MKSLPLIAAVVLGLAFAAHAAPETTPAEPAKAATDTAKPVEKAAKPMPMYRKVGGIDTGNRAITYTTKKGVKGVEKITDKTVIMQGDKPAQFSDIKVGDMVSGLHVKTKDNEFEILKITKFGPAAPKTKTPAEPVKKADEN